ncbi:MAG: toll/interleukin-1 receptor domain-containing protein [Lachnospiraceae bacterium]|nr:toll/interleukin-1 receptor domain-containing protein [Lachnospiraceae bacterium]
MARLIGDRPMTMSEDALYRFAMEKLPDYIYAAFACGFETAGGVRECDSLFFIPHMGVFIVEINGAVKLEVADGKIMLTYANDMTRQWRRESLTSLRYGVKDHLKRMFNVTPAVFDLQCFPYISSQSLKDQILSGILPREQLLLREDLEDENTFLLKLHLYKHLYGKLGIIDYRFCDLTDRMAHNIFYYWETGMTEPDRPTKPPFLFLSYNQFNATVAQEIKEELEQRGIFVWRAPEDVSIGNYYLPEEMEAIEQCDAFMILLSSTAQVSKEVRIEFEKAVELGKKILPIWVEDCTHEEFYDKALAKYQYRLMTKPNPSIITEITKAVKTAALERRDTGKV